MTDITYYDSGYIDPNYYVYTADAFVDLGQFIVEDYLEPDYFENTGVRITLTCEGTRVRFVEAAADLVVNFSQSVNGVIDVRAEVTLSSIVNLSSQEIRVREFNSDLSTTITQSTLASATFSPEVTFSSIASQLTAAFQNATGTITMETLVTATALVGVIKQFTNLINVGIRTGSPHLGIAVEPTFGVNSRFNTFTISVWVRRDTNPGTPQPIVSTRNIDAVNDAAFVFVGSDIQTRFNFDPDEPEAVWSNVAPTDGLWHHYLIRTVTRVGSDYGSSPGSANHWRLWIDGVPQGQTEGTGYQASGQMVWNDSSGGSTNTQGVSLGHGTVANFTGGYDRVGRTLDGAMAQLWMSYVSDVDFEPTDFYEGYVDFGTDGTRNGRLTTPVIYIPLEPTLTDLGVGVTAVYSVPEWSGEYLKYTTTKAVATVTAQPEAVLLVVAALSAQSDITAAAAKTIVMSASVSSEFTATTDNLILRLAQADLSTESQLDCLVTVQRSSAVDLASASTLQIDVIRIFAGLADLSSAFTATATVGEITEFNITLETAFTQTTEISRTRDLDSALESAVSISANAAKTIDIIAAVSSEFAATVITDRTRDHSVTLDAVVTLTVTVTRIPTITATLSSEFGLTSDAEKVVVAAGVFSMAFTQTTSAFKVVNGTAALLVEAFELTQGDILNFDPCREIAVESETRAAKTLPESRLLTVESETRIFQVPQETRVLRVEYETRVNTIKC